MAASSTRHIEPLLPSGGVTGQPQVQLAGVWTKKPVKVWNGSTWVEKPMLRWTGAAWVAV